MSWYVWLIIVAAGVFALAAISLRIFRTTRRGRRFLSLSTRGKIGFARALLRQPGTPLYAKALVVLLAGYLALPFDLIPDFIPILGQADDLLVVVVVMSLLILTIPRERFEDALRTAEEESAVRDATRRSHRLSQP